MAHKGTVTLYTPAGDSIVWDVEAEPLWRDGCCTFMQKVDGVTTRIRVMGTVVAEAYDTKDEAPSPDVEE